jgi:hypothetical protein
MEMGTDGADVLLVGYGVAPQVLPHMLRDESVFRR